ncbi:MAG: DNA-3-methyladenine glycosylase 2 family protein [Lachnospiraceae bacterium]|nr:DNA-3-methyladenine glycosylase 2 family protein [Lachnospiraceae bacterium]MBQ9606070.1 DNA-3-methyladenine glycosylase 2 family protein [Lachnospiraceae bacterium]
MYTTHIDNFDLRQIAESGQCFRMTMQDEKTARVIAGERLLYVTDKGGGDFEFSCEKDEFDTVWYDYFDLESDYAAYIDSIDKEDQFLKSAAAYGQGIRILRQEPFETLISFIISQRKNIPAIQSSVEKLCRCCGKKTDDGIYSFPEPETIAGLSEDTLCACSLGYRIPYVRETAKRVATGEIDLEALKDCDDAELFDELITLHGVGKKVANCVMLFSYHRIASFPVDVWIQRVEETYYNGHFPVEKYPGYAGIMQQYMFFYSRSR